MQETDFILQNKDKWQEFESVLQSKDKDPERLTDLFIETTDDLSFSRTYYPNRSVRVYLNGISQQVYQAIYKNKAREKNIFKKFWLEDLPEAMWHSRKALLWSFLLFVSGVSIGVLSSMYYPEFARIILGDSYIEMTEANIASGDPMAVYKDSEPIIMFFQIAWNNIRIAFGTFVLGIVFGIGTVYVVFYNAIMFGAFIYFFIERGLFRESFFAIMLHGTLELSMIVVAGCAGFALAKGLLFPGTFTRGQALIHSARNGIKILIGVTVLLIYAAIIESFATRFTEMPDLIRGIIIILSMAIVLGYFVIYPRRRHQNGHIKDSVNEETPASKRGKLFTNMIKSSGQIFTETFDIFATNARRIALLSLVLAILLTATFGIYTNWSMHEIYSASDEYQIPLGLLYPWDQYNSHLNFETFPLVYPTMILLFAGYVLLLFRWSKNNMNTVQSQIKKSTVLNIVLIGFITGLPLLLQHSLTFFIMPFYYPIALMWMYVTFQEKTNMSASLGRTFQLLKGNFWKLIGTFFATFLVQWICMFILSSQVLDFIVEFITTNIPRNAPLAEEAYTILTTFLLFFIPAFIFSLSIFGTALLYFSLNEINGAHSLISEIEKIGFKKRAYGLEQEI